MLLDEKEHNIGGTCSLQAQHFPDHLLHEGQLTEFLQGHNHSSSSLLPQSSIVAYTQKSDHEMHTHLIEANEQFYTKLSRDKLHASAFQSHQELLIRAVRRNPASFPKFRLTAQWLLVRSLGARLCTTSQ